MLAATTVIKSVIELMTEAYEGPPDPSRTWFIDNEPEAGIFGIIQGISSEEAFISVDGSGNSGTTIASHVEHLRWSLTALISATRGGPFGEWKESWRLIEADEANWDELRHALRVEFETLRDVLKEQKDLPEEYLSGFLALTPHAAYHLGTIRQMIERVRQPSR